MEIVQVNGTARVLVNTVYGFRRHANLAIQCTRDWMNADEESKPALHGLAIAAQTELSFLFGKYAVHPTILTKWLMQAELFP
jgi:hypothetical protein